VYFDGEFGKVHAPIKSSNNNRIWVLYLLPWLMQLLYQSEKEKKVILR